MLVSCLLYTLFGFFSGSILFSYYIPKFIKHVDVRDNTIDRNPGGANAMKAAGTALGLFCILLDVLKGFLPVFIAVTVSGSSGLYLAPVILAPVLGHAFSPLLGFRGGKAVAVSFGVLLGVWPLSKLVLLLALTLAFFRFLVIIRPDAAEVCLGFALVCGLSLVFEPLISIRTAFLCVSAVIIWKNLRSPEPLRPSIQIGHLWLDREDNRIRLRRL